jgi:DNA modification methylase
MQIRDRIKELRRVRARDLVRNRKNWRKHPPAQQQALLGLLNELGYADALLVRQLPDGSYMIIDGHLRADTTPDAMVPVLVLDLTEDEADKLLLTLDPLAAMATSDVEQLKALLMTVRTDNAAVEELLRRTAGPDLWSVAHPHDINEAEVALERAVELQRKWGTAPGQLWRILCHRIICADCTEQSAVARLLCDTQRRFRMIWTDPPYGISYGVKTAWMQRHGAQRQRAPMVNDSLPPDEIQKLFASALRIAAELAEAGAAIYATVPSGTLLPFFISALADGEFTFKHSLVWLKNSLVLGRGDYHYRHETILYGWREDGPHYFTDDRTQDSVFEVDRQVASPFHATTKPVALIARMIANSTRPGELIYDPFCGSGSTLLAAHQLGRIGFGVEIDPGNVAVTLERLALLGLKPELGNPNA